MNLLLSLFGLLATMLAQTAASPIAGVAGIARQIDDSVGCTVTIAACTEGVKTEVNLTPCACACLDSACDAIGGCTNPNGTPFKGNTVGYEFQTCVQNNTCIPVFAAGQNLDPNLFNCDP